MGLRPNSIAIRLAYSAVKTMQMNVRVALCQSDKITHHDHKMIVPPFQRLPSLVASDLKYGTSVDPSTKQPQVRIIPWLTFSRRAKFPTDTVDGILISGLIRRDFFVFWILGLGVVFTS